MGNVLTKHFWAINLLFVLAAAWLIVQLSLVIIRDRLTVYPQTGSIGGAPAPPVEKAEPYDRYAVILERNIFHPGEKGLKLLPLGERGTGTAGGAEAVQPPAGGLRLIGTATGPGGYSYAVFQEKGERGQKIHRLHERIDGGGEIVRIARHEVTIQWPGRREVLSVEDREARPALAAAGPPPPLAATVKKLSANRFLVNREDVDEAMGNLSQFMTQARFKPFFAAGRPAGFHVSEIKPGSLFERLGLRNNDVVKKINGQAISKPEEVFLVYQQLKKDSGIEIEIERNDRSEVFRYEIR